jgi:hypothetical protein
MVDKGSLEGMKLSIFGNSLDCRDRNILAGRSQQKTAILWLSIHEDSACSTHTMITPFFRSGQSQLIPQDIQECVSIFDSD